MFFKVCIASRGTQLETREELSLKSASTFPAIFETGRFMIQAVEILYHEAESARWIWLRLIARNKLTSLSCGHMHHQRHARQLQILYGSVRSDEDLAGQSPEEREDLLTSTRAPALLRV